MIKVFKDVDTGDYLYWVENEDGCFNQFLIWLDNHNKLIYVAIWRVITGTARIFGRVHPCRFM